MNQYKTIAIIVLIIAGGLLGGFVVKRVNKKTTQPVSNTINQPDLNKRTDAQTASAIKLEEQTNNEGGLLISAKPIDFAFEKPAQFEITFTTHQGDLDFDLTDQAILVDENNGNRLLPVSWSGGNGGHHLNGILVFPPLSKENVKMTLIIKDIYGVAERTFLWNLI